MIVGDERWQAENVAFFQETVTVNYVRDALERAAETLDGIMDSTVPALMLADYDSQRPLLEHRLNALPKMLSQPLYDIDEWPPMP